MSKSFDNTLTKEIIHKKQQIIDMKSNENEDLNQSFNASKNKRSISVVHYFSSREKINRIELENGIILHFRNKTRNIFYRKLNW